MRSWKLLLEDSGKPKFPLNTPESVGAGMCQTRYRFTSYHAVNTLCLGCGNQGVRVVFKNNRCTQWAERRMSEWYTWGYT